MILFYRQPIGNVSKECIPARNEKRNSFKKNVNRYLGTNTIIKPNPIYSNF